MNIFVIKFFFGSFKPLRHGDVFRRSIHWQEFRGKKLVITLDSTNIISKWILFD
jgi:hypothetical protein